jgi:hypothetical protein
VMMALPVDVAGLRPRLGDVEAPPNAEVESVFHGRGRVRAPGSVEAEVVCRGHGGVRALGSGEAEFVVFWG